MPRWCSRSRERPPRPPESPGSPEPARRTRRPTRPGLCVRSRLGEARCSCLKCSVPRPDDTRIPASPPAMAAIHCRKPWCAVAHQLVDNPASTTRPPPDFAPIGRQPGVDHPSTTRFRANWSTTTSTQGSAHGQREPVVADVDGDRAAVGDLAGDQQPGQRVADRGLDQPPQRTGAVRRVVAGVGQPGPRGLGDRDRDPAYGQPLLEQRRAAGRRCARARPW